MVYTFLFLSKLLLDLFSAELLVIQCLGLHTCLHRAIHLPSHTYQPSPTSTFHGRHFAFTLVLLAIPVPNMLDPIGFKHGSM